MQGKQKIIDELLSSARSTAAAVIAEATEQSNAELEELRAELEKARAEADTAAQVAADAAYSGRVKLGELEANKELLRAKQACVSAVYDGVREKLLSASDVEYLKILQAYIISACEDGDEVIAAKRDAKRVTAAWIKKVSASAKKKLKLSDETGDFSGGVILRNAKYDRDLTVDAIVEELKERTVADTVAKLGL